MTTWTCGGTTPTPSGGRRLCGHQVQSVDAPPGRCRENHLPGCWSPLPLWRCVDCGDQRLGSARPTAPCVERHSDAWEPVDAFASPIVEAQATPVADARIVVSRERMPPERVGVTRKFRLRYQHRDGTPDEMKLYFTASSYPDGRLGEVFVKADRMGTLARGALDATATMVSLLLQHGVPLATVTAKLRHTRYGPDGFTGDPEFPSCSSPLDLLAQWLDRRWGGAP